MDVPATAPSPAPAGAPAPHAGTVDVSLVDVTAGYGDRVALEHVSIEVPKGSLLAVVGPNGAGKSTLLKLMAGLARPWSGGVRVLGGPAGREARRVAYVPQAELVDWAFPVTVEDVVMMGRFPRLGPVRRPAAEDRRAVHDALDPGADGPPSADPDRPAVGRAAPAGLPRPGARRGPGPVPARRAGDGHRPDDPGAADGPARGAGPRRADGRRDHPRPRLRRGALPAGARGQPHASWPTGRPTSCSTPACSRGRTAATCWCSAARPSCSTTPTTTTTPRPASTTSTSTTDDGPRPRAARRRVLHPRARRAGHGRRRVRGRRHVRRPARHRVHRRRDRARGVPGRRRGVPAPGPVLPRGGGGRGQHRARDRVRDQALGAAPGHGDRRPVRGHVRARRVPVQLDPGLRRGPVQLPVRQRAGDRGRRTWSRS